MINLPCIRSTQRVLGLFDRLGYDQEKVKILVNRYIPGEEITVEDVEDTLEHAVFWKIPNNYFAVMTAINRGIPVYQLDNGATIYENFLGLAKQITGRIKQDINDSKTSLSEAGSSLLKGLFQPKTPQG